MNGWVSKIAGGSLVLLLLVAIFLGGYSSLLSHRLQLARQQAAEQQKTLAQQAGLIATLQTQDAQNRALMAAQQQREQQLRQQHDTAQRKYREAIKNDPCAGQPLPAAVLELLRPATGTAPGAVNPPSP
ncbi:DUF2570 family protein [Serratia marcescens]|uniref:DUF2570 family protein n=1 Tax=Serratia marcescens TaxID=615 RepID=UPI0018D5DAE2|nr:DUF2570 family protein [Serratia marcescens]MBH2564215.1 DUF2570 family protein [Serratia marcescens]MDX7486399.1 DUF2570 family protein [Serratia marcescens]HAT3746331.1 DUF2570 domain-containing protein [Serratia marcescens]HAT3786581.1 DUF2570 domain-containing protein [Serratia marcescens]HAT3791706.1 DUF2570 domain-containing protein [Serratia marcescens]